MNELVRLLEKRSRDQLTTASKTGIHRAQGTTEGDEVGLSSYQVLPIAQLVTQLPFSEVGRPVFGEEGIVQAQHVQSGKLRPIGNPSRRIHRDKRLSRRIPVPEHVAQRLRIPFPPLEFSSPVGVIPALNRKVKQGNQEYGGDSPQTFPLNFFRHVG